jgi:cell division protease FtsH
VNSNSTVKTILFWVSIVFLGVMLWKLVSANGNTAREEEPSYSEFMARVDANDVKEVTLYLSPNAYELQGEYIRPQFKKFHLTVFKESAPDLAKQLREKQVPLKVKEVRSGDWVLILLNAAPLILLVAFCLFLMRQMQAGGNKALSFGKSRARLLSAQQKKATFKDVAGTDEAKEELQEIIEFLKDPQKFQKLGGRIPKARGKLCWRERLRARRMCRSFPFRDRTSWKCSWA